jgi:hypothetical protein
MVLTTPLPGDVLVRRDEERERYSIVEADTGKRLAGPFDDERNANSVAMSDGEDAQRARLGLAPTVELVRLI